MFDDNPLDKKEEAKKDKREQIRRRNAYEMLEVALLDFDDAVTDEEKNADGDKTLELRNARYEKFNQVISHTQKFCETFDVKIPYIENEWRYYTLKEQEADIASIEQNESILEAFFENFPLEGHQTKIDEFIKSIDAVARSRIGAYPDKKEKKE